MSVLPVFQQHFGDCGFGIPVRDQRVSLLNEDENRLQQSPFFNTARFLLLNFCSNGIFIFITNCLLTQLFSLYVQSSIGATQKRRFI